jgi:hypothetical protein
VSNAPPALTPALRVSGFVGLILRVLDTLSMFGPFPRPLAQRIRARLLAIAALFRRIAEQVAAGTYRPRRPSTRTAATVQKPRAESALPTGPDWLSKLLPEPAMFRGNLWALLQTPEVVAVIVAAPGPLRRPLRSLCHMLGVEPPPILARPGTREAAPPPPPAPEAPPPPLPAPRPPPSAPARPRPGGLALDISTGRPRLVWT